MALEFYGRGWRAKLKRFLCAVESRLTIVSPYIRTAEAKFVRDHLAPGADIITITHLSTDSILSDSLQTGALKTLMSASAKSRVVSVPNLHAKVYIADDSKAIITSANLTMGGIERNYEYGVAIDDSKQVFRIIEEWGKLEWDDGWIVNSEDLVRIGGHANAARRAQAEKLPKIKEEITLRRFLKDLEKRGSDKQSGGRSLQAVFKAAVMDLLEEAYPNPQVTQKLYEGFSRLHPELCTDERHIINGRDRGEKWKHRLRTAQQGLKRQGKITNDSARKLWMLTESQGRKR